MSTQSFRQKMTPLHSWAGLIAGWILYFMFVTGTLGYFDTEIDRWMVPEQSLPVQMDRDELVQIGQSYLQAHAREAVDWVIGLPNDRDPSLRVSWQMPAKGDVESDQAGEPYTTHHLNVATGEALPLRKTGGGQLLYQMHYRLHYLPFLAAFSLVAICTLLMFVGLLTGIIIHKKIFVDFFTLRLNKGQRSWLDAHNLVTVLSMPFQLMITYTGLAFLLSTYMTLIVGLIYGFGPADIQRFIDGAFIDHHVEKEAANIPAPLFPLPEILATADQIWGKDVLGNSRVDHFHISHPGDQNSVVSMESISPYPFARAAEDPHLFFNGATGEILSAGQREDADVTKVGATLFRLHEGNFAKPLVRWLYFLGGLLGVVMIGTGLILWSVKRKQKYEQSNEAIPAGHRLVERLNIGTLVGLPIAIAAYFLANRILPAEMYGREDWEVHVMFLSWLAMFLYTFLRAPNRVWIEEMMIASVLFLSVPVVNVLTTQRHLVITLAHEDWALASVDLMFLAMGLFWAGAAWCVYQQAEMSSSDLNIVPSQPIGEAAR